jgi:hypothetical protein
LTSLISAEISLSFQVSAALVYNDLTSKTRPRSLAKFLLEIISDLDMQTMFKKMQGGAKNLESGKLV